MVRGPVSFVIVGAVLLGIMALVTLGPDRVADHLPAPLADAFASLAAGLGGGNVGGFGGSADTPEALVSDTGDGLVATGPIAALAGNRPVFIDAVIDGYTARVARDIPAGITTIRPIMGCLVTAPSDAAVVGHVTAGDSDLPLALSTYNDADLAQAVQRFVDAYRATGMTAVPGDAGLAYQAFDVAVTETAAPVYLVLENRHGNRIWNIHLAPGARIERVVLLGGAQAGVANLDPVVPVEVLLADGLAACGIAPAYSLNPGSLFFQSVASGAIPAAEAEVRLAGIEAAVAAYDQWFRDTFGVTAAARAGFARGRVAAIGPVPGADAGRAVYAPIAGAEIRTTQDAYFEIRGQVPEGQDFAARVRATATAFAFGDLANLRQGAAY